MIHRPVVPIEGENVMTRHMLPLLATLVVVVACVPASVAAAPMPKHPSGERIIDKQVLIPLTDWNTGKVFIGSTPESCQYVETCAPGSAATVPKSQIQRYYLVVYPKGSKVHVQCHDIPYENCPDHGPLIAAGAEQLVPSVYGNGVLGHIHLSAPLNDKTFRPLAAPTLVLFKTRKAAQELLVTKKEVFAAVKRGDAFLYPVPQYTFMNFVVPNKLYAEAKPLQKVAAPALGSTAAPLPAQPTGERINSKQVLVPVYNWTTGKVMIGATPVSCHYVNDCAPGMADTLPKAQTQPYYVIAYPKGSTVHVACRHIPVADCADRPPVDAAAAKLNPAVYGQGVVGYNNLSAPRTSPEFRPVATPTLVLFKTRAAADEAITTKKQLLAAVARGDATLHPAPQYTFINFVVDPAMYVLGTPKPSNGKPTGMYMTMP